MMCCKILVGDGHQQLLKMKKKVLSWSLVSVINITYIPTGLVDQQIDGLKRQWEWGTTYLIIQVSAIKYVFNSIKCCTSYVIWQCFTFKLYFCVISSEEIINFHYKINSTISMTIQGKQLRDFFLMFLSSKRFENDTLFVKRSEKLKHPIS